MIFFHTLVILAIDTIWLTLIKTQYNKAIATIQGSPAFIRPIYAIPVYIALGYLLTFPRTKEQAFFLGLCTYAVYDFTVLALFHKYPLNIALMDTLWGGILMFSAYLVVGKMKKYFQ